MYDFANLYQKIKEYHLNHHSNPKGDIEEFRWMMTEGRKNAGVRSAHKWVLTGPELAETLNIVYDSDTDTHTRMTDIFKDIC